MGLSNGMQSAETFSRNERLRKTRDFRRVYNRSASFRRGFLTLKIAPNDLAATRMGIVVPSRVVKLSSRRNRLKRMTREVYRKNKSNVRRGFDLVIGVKADPGDNVSYALLEEIFLELLRRGDILI